MTSVDGQNSNMNFNYSFKALIALRGSAPFEKFFFIIHLREKRVKEKLMSMWSHPKFV